MANFRAETEGTNEKVSVMSSLLGQVGERLLTIASQAIMNGLRQMWSDAVDYATAYYDSLNEIRIVTMRSQEEANA